MRRDDEVVTEESYSIFTFETLRNFHFEVSRLLKLFLLHYLSSDKIPGHPECLADKRKKLSLLRLSLFRVYSTILAQSEEKYPLSDLRVNFAKIVEKAKLNRLFTVDKPRGMIERTNYYAVDTVFPFVAPFLDKSPGFVERCDFTRMNVLYTKMVSKLPFDHNGAAWTAEEVASLLSNIWMFKTVVERSFGPHCSAGLFTMKYRHLNHVVES